ncbi:MAG: adenosylcobinamide-GDP ribazoletransferase [Anaerophaga sp.]|nr:adenosylcobinamide-GDP ribazoletransferase [Anaerophaga sp.]
MIKRELNILFSSILYFTRLSLPFKIEYRKENQQLATTWLPLIGIIVGSIVAAVFFFADKVLPQSVAVLLSLTAGVLVTGAFHEDGFADVCDAFGGGYTADQRLRIMRDPRVGAYAVTGIVLLFSMKIALLIEMDAYWIPFVLIAAHTLSRWSVLIISMGWQYARPTGESKSRDISHPVSRKRFIWAFIMGVSPLFLFDSWWGLVTVPGVVISALLAGVWCRKRIGGYTGDCLGALQQVNEVLIMAWFLIVTT